MGDIQQIGSLSGAAPAWYSNPGTVGLGTGTEALAPPPGEVETTATPPRGPVELLLH